MVAETFTATKQTTFKDQITGVLAEGLKVGKAAYSGSGDASAMTIAAYDVSVANAGYVYGLNVAGPNSTHASGTILNAITTYIAAPMKSAAGAITNSYSLRLANPSGATNNYSLWAEGNAKIDGTSIALGTTASATTVTVGGAATINTLKIAGTLAGTINLTTDVTTGIVNIFDSLTGTANIVKAATTINIGSTDTAPTMTLGGGTTVAATLIVGGAVGGNIIKLRSATDGTISLTTDANNTAVNIFTAATGTVSIGSGSSAINMGGLAANPFVLSLGKSDKDSTLSFLSASTQTVTINSGATSGLISIFTSPTGSANILTGANGTISIGGSGSTTVIGGNLTVNGTVTTINSNTLTVDDKNIELASVASVTISSVTHTIGAVTGNGSAATPWTAQISNMSTTAGLIIGSAITAVMTGTAKLYTGTAPLGGVIVTAITSTTITFQVVATVNTLTPVAGIDLGIISTTGATDATANGAGITVKGPASSDKTLNWLSTTAAWTSSENFDLATTGKTYKIGGNDALSATTLKLSDALAVPASIQFTTVTKQASAGNTITTSSTLSTIVFAGSLTTDGLEAGMGMTISGASAATYTAGTYIVSIDSAAQITLNNVALTNAGASTSAIFTFGMKAASQIITLPSATSSVATLALAETLQNKTLAGSDRNKSRINFNFGQVGTKALTLGWAGASGQTITFPDLGEGGSATLLTTLTGLGLTQGTSGDNGAAAMGASVLRFGNYTLRGKTTDATAVRLTYTGAAYSSGSTIPVAAKTTVNANINISAYDSTNNKSASWQITATFARQSGSVILLGDPLVTASSDSEMASCFVDIDPDTSNNSLQLQCTGNASNKTIYWAAAITTIEMTGV